MADKYYMTRYTPKMCVYRKEDEPKYITGVWASSYENAQALIDIRNIPGEYLDDALPWRKHYYAPIYHYVGDSFLDKSRKYFNNALHGLSFLSYIAMCAGVSDSHSILGDGGILHEYIHVITNAHTMYLPFEHVMVAVIDLEISVPGALSEKQRKDARRYQTTLQERIAHYA